MAEIDLVVSSTDDGVELTVVKALQEKNNVAMDHLVEVKGDVDALHENKRLGFVQLSEIDQLLVQLQNKVQKRKVRLDESMQLQQLLNDHHYMLAWLRRKTDQAADTRLVSDESEAIALLAAHDELKLSVDAKNDSAEMLEIKLRSNTMIKRQHYAASLIAEQLSLLDQHCKSLNELLLTRGSHLKVDRVLECCRTDVNLFLLI